MCRPEPSRERQLGPVHHRPGGHESSASRKRHIHKYRRSVSGGDGAFRCSRGKLGSDNYLGRHAKLVAAKRETLSRDGNGNTLTCEFMTALVDLFGAAADQALPVADAYFLNAEPIEEYHSCESSPPYRRLSGQISVQAATLVQNASTAYEPYTYRQKRLGWLARVIVPDRPRARPVRKLRSRSTPTKMAKRLFRRNKYRGSCTAELRPMEPAPCSSLTVKLPCLY
jgi:hypothetical protein